MDPCIVQSTVTRSSQHKVPMKRATLYFAQMLALCVWHASAFSFVLAVLKYGLVHPVVKKHGRFSNIFLWGEFADKRAILSLTHDWHLVMASWATLLFGGAHYAHTMVCEPLEARRLCSGIFVCYCSYVASSLLLSHLGYILPAKLTHSCPSRSCYSLHTKASQRTVLAVLPSCFINTALVSASVSRPWKHFPVYLNRHIFYSLTP